MAEISQVVPDLLDRQETLALGGVARPYTDEEESARISAQVLSVDGIYVTPSESPVAYGDKTRREVLADCERKPQPRIYFYGGWSNGMTLGVNICALVALGSVPLSQIKVRHIKEGLQSPDRPPMFYDYRSNYDSLSGWKDMVRLKRGIPVSQVNQDEYEEMTLAYLLLEIGGAPTRWTLMVTIKGRDEPLLPPTTSSPFPGNEYGNGFIASYLKPVFAEGVFGKAICNTTGSRAVDSIALANLLVRLRHNAKTAIEIYVEDARRRLEEMEKKAREKGVEFKPPYTMEEAGRYAPLFVETQEPVIEEITGILAKYPEGVIEGFQYAVNITSDRSLATAVYKISRARPYAWVKTPKGWEVAV